MEENKKTRILPWLLVILPLWLIASGAFALVKYFKDEDKDQIEAERRFAKSVSAASIDDDLKKIIEVLGERNTSKPDQLSATASMIAGTLGPSNTGYQVSNLHGPGDFPILKVSIPSLKKTTSAVWILTSYDSPAGSPGAEKNASGLAATIAAAQSLADFSPSRPIHFVFIPHVNEENSPIIDTLTIVSRLIQNESESHTILCVEAMGYAERLILSSRETSALPSFNIDDLGQILGTEVVCLGDDFDLASTLFEMNLPALRVSTRPMLLPDEPDTKVPFAPTLAASTGRMIELIKRLSK